VSTLDTARTAVLDAAERLRRALAVALPHRPTAAVLPNFRPSCRLNCRS